MSGGTFNGDDVNALVFDFGSHTCKVGYGGDFEPKFVFPSVVGKLTEQIEVKDEDINQEAENISGSPKNDKLRESCINDDKLKLTKPDQKILTEKALKGSTKDLNENIEKLNKKGPVSTENIENIKPITATESVKVPDKNENIKKPTNLLTESTDLDMETDTIELEKVQNTLNAKNEEKSKSPKYITKVRYLVGTMKLSLPLENVEIIYPIYNGGTIENFEMYKHLIKFAYDELKVDPKNHPLIISEPAWNKQEMKEQLINYLFEKWEIPAVQVIKSPVLALFSQAKSTGLVVDIGHTTVSVTPVVEGQVLKQGILRSLFAGQFIIDQCRDWLAQSDAFMPGVQKNFWPLVLPYEIKSKKDLMDLGKTHAPKYVLREDIKNLRNLTESWKNYQEKIFLEDFAKQVIQVSDHDLSMIDVTNFSSKHFEFPNGYSIDFNNQRVQIAEYLFDPSPLGLVQANSMLGMQHLMIRSGKACDGDVRQQLLNNIHLVGGGSCFNGLVERTNTEIATRIGSRIKLIQPNIYSSNSLNHRTAPYNNNERRFATWIGGSIIASLGSFHSMWISKSEWEENGAACFESKNGV